ncbi:MAG TPA: vWA domain-containing protein [Polyangiaceae bacterium]|nr:MAG: hypothetical protein BWY17_01020 [Deltaproteobacteria bacterium ADurb.Bin207]HNS96454.1 vWA domain-containing protein [Polyangiaceae bacterium]HNZ21421.1 vWA domain-containing protein [Polyangiaceae bacterium]HOD23259.1 vWA domain-containing protein [Polyangiaceae bacterium]HOE51990.1 vWA domain-containing protein [Polyangiaceae bacterium]
MRFYYAFRWVPITIGFTLAACSASGDSNSKGLTSGTGGSPSTTDGSIADTTSVEDSTVHLDVTSSNDGPLPEGDVCVGTKSNAQPTPLNVMVMLDQSSSMKGARWTSVVNAIKSFTQAPEAAGIRIALNYFALTAPCNTNADCKSVLGSCGSTKFCTFDDYCDASAYETPEVEFAELPGAAGAIAASLDAHAPLFNTPTPPALLGAINHAKAWAIAHPSETVVVVLATDGEPDSVTCKIGSGDVSKVVAIAQGGLQATPSIPTYVIGVGNHLSSLNSVAEAGGTTKAYIVDGGGGNATQKQFLDAMNAIRGSALPCSYVIPDPPSGTLDYGKVNVLYTSANGTTSTIGQVPSAADCDASGGWYYDDPVHPNVIVVCPATCELFHTGSAGSVEIQLGCKTVQVK